MVHLLPLDVAPQPAETIGPWLLFGILILAVFFGMVIVIRKLRRRR